MARAGRGQLRDFLSKTSLLPKCQNVYKPDLQMIFQFCFQILKGNSLIQCAMTLQVYINYVKNFHSNHFDDVIIIILSFLYSNNDTL